MRDLDPTLRDAIDFKFRQARQQLKDGAKQAALVTATTAWESLPEPKFDWDVTQSYVLAFAGIYRDAQHYHQGIRLIEGLFSSGTVLPYEDRPRFVLGTIYYELGDLDNAKKWLSEASKISKGRCFREEPEKYRNLIMKK